MNCMNATKYEIDMLGVGAADALLVRFFDENDKAYIILVDAGNYCNGETIAKFVKERYNTFQIDLAICTHCDDDHFGGFIFLLEDMKNNPQTSVDIKKILINDPGLHITQNDVKYYQNLDNVRKEARSVYDGHGNNLLELIWDLSRKRRLSYSEAFSDGYNSEFDGLIDILGPSTEYYRTQALLFRNDLQPYDYAIVDDSEDAYEIPETKNIYSKKLDEAGSDPSHHNKSSIIFLFKPDDEHYFLFTGDADEDSFSNFKYRCDVDKIKNIYWMKIPHHGSAHNMSNNMINHIRPSIAYVSTEKYGHYLDKSVVGALKKIGTSIYSTKNSVNIWHHHNTPDREDYLPVETL